MAPLEQLVQALLQQQTALTEQLTAFVASQRDLPQTIVQQQAALTEQLSALVASQRDLPQTIASVVSASLTSRVAPLSLPPFPPYEEAAEEWEDYEKRLRQHFVAFGVVDDQLRKSLFLSWISPKVYQLLSQLAPLRDPASLSFAEMCDMLSAYYRKNTHVVASRVAFYKCRKQPHQSYRAWAAELQGLSRKCQFITDVHHESYADYMVRDAILRLAPDKEVRQRALQLPNPSLSEVLSIAQSYEVSRAAGAQIEECMDVSVVQPSSAVDGTSVIYDDEEVAAVSARPQRRVGHSSVKKQQQRRTPQQPQSQGRQGLPSCPRCFTKHNRENCPQRWATCRSCNKKGHIASVCRSNKPPAVDDDDNDSVMTVNCVLSHSSKLYIDVTVLDKVVRMQVDTGSAVTLINSQTYLALGSPPLSLVTRNLRTYNKQKIPIVGQFEAAVTYKSVVRSLNIFVVDNAGTENLFGYDAFQLFGFSISDDVHLVSDDIPYTQLDALCAEFSSLFSSGLGCAVGFEARITLKPAARPKFFRARPIPVALREPVKVELDRLAAMGALLPVTSSEWASPLVVVRKPNGSLRLCGDFKATVNAQSLIDTYPLPRPDELFAKLAGGQFFSKIDLSEAYHQLPLDADSKRFLVLNTPFGLYQYQRLPFGVASAPAIFQRFLEQLTASVPGCINYQDDIVVTGASTDEHLDNLRKLFQVLLSAGLKCNLAKSQFFQSSIVYLGFQLTRDGIRPLRQHVAAIAALPRPSNVKELQAFLGKIAYYHKFLPSAAEVAHPLHQLLRKNVPFTWSDACERAFVRLQEQLQSAPCLATFRPGQHLVLATDASQYGLGAVLAHRYADGSERPIAYASKTLNEAQRRYSQIEKEALSIVYGLKKFSVFLYGSKFHLITDHKPLVSLFNPSASIPDKAAHRLQRWALYLSRFNYEIHYRPTAQHANADALSRLPMGPDLVFDRDELLCFNVDEEERRAVDGFPITGETVASATADDPVLRRVLKFIQQGWPDRPSGKASDPLRNYYAMHLRLSVRDGVVLLATDGASPRVVVPASLRRRVLQLLHQGHWGVSRTKNLARRHVYWPGIDADISRMVALCTQCAQQSAAPRANPSPWPVPARPWERVHADFAGPFLGTYWLLVIDAYSNFPFVVRCASPTTAATTNALAKIFALEGLPSTLVTDNGPQFSSQAFADFCSGQGVRHVTAPPFHPQSNGEAERLVRTFKCQMKKFLTEFTTDEALLHFLSSYRFTPMGDRSPAELLHGRQPRTLLHLLRFHPSRATSHPPAKFRVGTPVWVRGYGSHPKWIKGVIKTFRGCRMCDVRTEDGMVTRHLDQMRPRAVEPPLQTAVHEPAQPRNIAMAPATNSHHLWLSPVLPTSQGNQSPSTDRVLPSHESTFGAGAPAAQPPATDALELSPVIQTRGRVLRPESTQTSPPPAPDTSEMSPTIQLRGRVPRTGCRPGHFRPYVRVAPRDLLATPQEQMDVSSLYNTLKM